MTEKAEKEVKKWNKKESYSKKALEMGKKVLENLYSEPEINPYQFYPYEQLIELLEEKMNIDMDYGLLVDIIDELVDEEKVYWIKKTTGVYFQE